MKISWGTAKLAVIMAFTLLFSMKSEAQTEYKVYSGLMFHFIKYTQWPSPGGEIVLGVFGKSPMNTEAMALNGKMAGSMKVVVKEIHNVAEVDACQILFVPSNQSSKYSEIAPKAKQHHVLVVSNSPSAIKNGVVVNFFEEDSKVKFEISNKNAAENGLKISSELQKLAKIVD